MFGTELGLERQNTVPSLSHFSTFPANTEEQRDHYQNYQQIVPRCGTKRPPRIIPTLHIQVYVSHFTFDDIFTDAGERKERGPT